ncbi:unnamed protein product, partial [Didymodactylos carnosus]
LSLSPSIIENNDIQNETYLHYYTSISTEKYCQELASILRSADINKTQSTQGLLAAMNVDNLFKTRRICLLCQRDLHYKDKKCSKCRSVDEKTIANVYDVNVEKVLTTTIQRLSSEIEENKQKINVCNDEQQTNDVVFEKLYQQLLKQNSTQNIISLLLHLDGVGLTKSTRSKMWLFSGSIIEVPSKHRYRRYNMVLMSIWVGYTEPHIHMWLKSIVNESNYMKNQGTYQCCEERLRKEMKLAQQGDEEKNEESDQDSPSSTSESSSSQCLHPSESLLPRTQLVIDTSINDNNRRDSFDDLFLEEPSLSHQKQEHFVACARLDGKGEDDEFKIERFVDDDAGCATETDSDGGDEYKTGMFVGCFDEITTGFEVSKYEHSQ